MSSQVVYIPIAFGIVLLLVIFLGTVGNRAVDGITSFFHSLFNRPGSNAGNSGTSPFGSFNADVSSQPDLSVRYCPKCGNPIKHGSSFCGVCGNRVE